MILVLSWLLVLGCAPPLDLDDASGVDRGDTAMADTATPMETDEGEESGDTAVVDSATGDTHDSDTAWPGPLPGPGVLTGSCGAASRRGLAAPDPALFRNALDLMMLEVAPSDLSDGGEEVLTEGTVGGSSEWSEAFAFEVLHRCESAVLLKTESEIRYAVPDSKRTDLLVDIGGVRYGVSVVRAFQYPPDSVLGADRALEIVEGKLSDILLSTAAAHPDDAWDRQFLSVMAWNDQHADAIEVAWSQVDPATRADTIVVLTVTDGDDRYLYLSE